MKWVYLFNKKISSKTILIDTDTTTGEPIIYSVKYLFVVKRMKLNLLLNLLICLYMKHIFNFTKSMSDRRNGAGGFYPQKL